MSTDERSRELLRRLLGPSRPEVTCGECFELLDEYVELELEGDDADRHLPGMREARREDGDLGAPRPGPRRRPTRQEFLALTTRRSHDQ